MENNKVKRKTELTADELGRRLYRFITNRKKEKAMLLINDPKCNVNWVSAYCRSTPLIQASICGQPDIVKTLLKRQELLINHQEWCNYSALIWATIEGHTRCVELLVNDSRTNINFVGDDKHSALWRAYNNSCPSIIKLLLSHGANVNGIHVSVDKHSKVYAYPQLTVEATLVMKNWKSYLPEFTRFAKTNKCYPVEFKQWAFNFILCCIKSKAFCKDIIYLLLEYIAKAWKKI